MENYNYLYDESGHRVTIYGRDDYENLPDLSPLLILKNNQYVKEMQEIALSCIPMDIVSPNYNSSGAMYITFLYILCRFSFYLFAENCTNDQINDYLRKCENLIPELLYKAKYRNKEVFSSNIPMEPESRMDDFDNFPERIRFLFFLALKSQTVWLSATSSYLEKLPNLKEGEGRLCKNDFGASINILCDTFDSFSFPKKL